jgi:hypothetical protein
MGIVAGAARKIEIHPQSVKQVEGEHAEVDLHRKGREP